MGTPGPEGVRDPFLPDSGDKCRLPFFGVLRISICPFKEKEIFKSRYEIVTSHGINSLQFMEFGYRTEGNSDIMTVDRWNSENT